MRIIPSFLLAAFLAISAAAQTTQWVPSPSWDSGAYAYDGAGNITAIGNDEYRYDGAGRLVSGTAHGAGGTSDRQSYLYDRYGNLTKITTGAFVTALAVAPATNRLDGTCAPGFDTCLTAAFDADTGAMTARPHLNHSFEWDALGMLREIDVVSRAERYVYDANDERIATVTAVSGGERRRYTLRGAGQKVLRELVHDTAANTWSWSKDYVYRDGTILAAWLPEGNGQHPDRHYHVDHLGTPRVITDTRRNKIAEHTYWPFGSDAPGSTLYGERMRFTGHERDSSSIHNPLAAEPGTDFDYMHARYYGPGMGRFLSVDPGRADLGKPQSWNRYSYTMNDPINNTDPDGRETNPVTGQSYILDSQILNSANNPRKGFFGWVRRNEDGSPKKHGGNDIAAPRGTPVFAPVSGTVVQSCCHSGSAGAGGHVLRIRRANDENGQAVYIHISHLNKPPNVQVGDTVVEGQPNVAEVGNTGNAKREPPHAHTAVMVGGETTDHQVDPQQWFRDHPSAADSEKTREPCEPGKKC